MNKHMTTAGPTGLSRIRSLLAFRHQNPVARLVSTLVAFAIAALLVGANLSPVQAVTPCDLAGGFEIDGNMAANTCSGDDWSAHTISATDVASTTQGGTYSTSKKDDSDPSLWSSAGSTPDKADFGVAYSFAKIVNGHYFVYVAWERDGTSGTGGYVIELDNSAPNAPGGVPQPDRSSGGSSYYISTVGGGAPSLTCDGAFTSQATYGVTCPPPSLTGFYGQVNDAAITDSFSNLGVDAHGFYEVALDITQLTGTPPGCPGPDAASLYIRSLTGEVKNGNLKGYLAPLELQPDSTCVRPTITTQTEQNAQIDGLDVVAPGTPQHDVATVTGTQAHPAPTGSVTFSLCGPTGSPADCTTGGQTGGTDIPLDQGLANSTAQSDDVAPTALGWYCWRAHFTPDPVNDTNPFLPATATDKTNECFKVAYANPTISTLSSATPDAGAAANSVGFTTLGDVATLSGVVSGADLSTQHVTFKLYGPLASTPGANDCTVDKLVTPAQDVLLENVNATTWTATAPTYKPTASDGPGYYTWVASYAGDDINHSFTAACGALNETQHLVGPLLTLTKGTPHSLITAGDPVVYDLNIKNVGDGTASNVVVTDTLPILKSGNTWSLDATSGYNCEIAGAGTIADPQVVTCDVGNLNPLPTLTQIAEVTATTTPADCGDINNSAELTADPNVDQTVGPRTVTVQCPGLTINKTADAASVDVGSTIGFTVIASNNGAGTATGVLVNDPLPTGPGITWTIDADPLKTHGPLSCVIDSGILKCTGSLDASGDNQTQVVHVTSPTEWTGSGESEVNSCLGGTDNTGVYDNTATVSADNVIDSPNDSASEAVLCPDLHITKTEDATAVNAGTSIGFTVTATNTGAGAATGALISDPLPTGVTWAINPQAAGCSIDAGTGVNLGHQVLTCTGTIGAGGSKSVHVTAPTSFASCGTYDNTATLTATNTPQSPQDSASTEVVCADVVVHKTSEAASVSVGSDIGFTVTITNNGDGQASGVHVVDGLPAGQGVDWSVDSSTGPLTCSIDGSPSDQTLTCDGDLAASGSEGDTQTVHVTSGTVRNADMNSCGVYDNTATFTWANGPDATLSSNTASESVLCSALTLTKTADAASVNAGSQIGFTVTVSNSDAEGTGTAAGVVVNDPLPAGGGVSWSIQSGPQGCVIQGSAPSQTLHCDPVDLAPGELRSVHVVSATTTASCQAYPNVASLTATNAPGLTASATTGVICVAPVVVVSPPQVKPPAVLPNTGGPTAGLLGAGLLLLLGGGTLVMSDRRRRRRS